jgi:protease-4
MSFIKAVLKWFFALIVAYGLLFVLMLVLLLGVALSFEGETESVESETILVLDLGFNLTDQPPEEDPARIAQSAFSGELRDSLSLRQVVETLERAREDSRISGLLLTGSMSLAEQGGSLASLMEVRRSIEKVAADKPVWAYLDGDTLRDIYLKSAATQVYANPYATLDFRGLRAEQIYLGDAFERVGIEVQVEAFEEYKTAAESFQNGTMSAAQREQLSVLLSDVWSIMVSDIARNRDVPRSQLEAVATSDIMPMGEELVEYGFADELVSSTELIRRLSEAGRYEPDNKTFRQIGLAGYLASEELEFPDISGDDNTIAVIYAEGGLVDGEGDRSVIGADRVVRDLRQLREDDSVKAIVLRVNSPGGSATGAFKVAREIIRTNEVKPVVASMGGMAASAGYMISAPCEEIIAESCTITGSIGVVMLLANVEQLAHNWSINFESIQTHPFAGTFSLGRSKSEAEMAQLRQIGADFYDEFLDLVATSRGMQVEQVRELARGRVWSGKAALDLGLIDAHGGLARTIQRAADLAGIGDNYRIEERPRARTLEEQFEELFGANLFRGIVPGSTGGPVNELLQVAGEEWERLSQLNDPFAQYAVLPYTLKIR